MCMCLYPHNFDSPRHVALEQHFYSMMGCDVNHSTLNVQWQGSGHLIHSEGLLYIRPSQSKGKAPLGPAPHYALTYGFRLGATAYG
jgi:hypothetical protein